jgi:hypothetical protein
MVHLVAVDLLSQYFHRYEVDDGYAARWYSSLLFSHQNA